MRKKRDEQPLSLFDNMGLLPVEKKTTVKEDPTAPALDNSSAGDGLSANSASEGALTGHGPLRDLMDDNFLQYTGYVICSRAIPAIEDGLKPVQRRILHALSEKDDGNFIKVATVVGHTMAYHPHGDASIGDALVVLTNKLWGKGYLIKGQGNFGNLYTGMPAAAPRYIECCLTDLARNEIFNKKTTRYIDSYDSRNREPVLLPAKIPLLLMLGAEGIAVGLSTSILPHNFIELLQAEIDILQKRPVQIYPDFQLGGLMDVSEYDDGRGKIKLRAVIEKRDKNKLVITQLPCGETTDSLISDIEDAIRKKKVAVRQIHDLTAQNVEIELVLATGAVQEKVISSLYAFTDCEKSISSRPVVLDGGRPVEMSVSEILKKNVGRLSDLTRSELEIRLGELDNLYHARTLDRIFVEERIYKRIEQEKTWQGVHDAVLSGFEPFLGELRRAVSDEDIERLLKIPIRRISLFDIEKNRRDIEAILAEEADVKDNLQHLKAYVIKYLKGLIKTYSKQYPRCTKIAEQPFKEVDVRAITAHELTVRYDAENGYLGTSLRGGEELFKCSSLDKLLCVWKDGAWKMMPPPDKLFVDKNLVTCMIFNREEPFTCVYTEPDYGFTYIKRFAFGGAIQNKEYRLAPPKSKILLFEKGTPETLYVKYKPVKSQRIHQQQFTPSEVLFKGVSARGVQMTSKPISRVSVKKPTWWDENEKSPRGLLS